MLTMRTFPNLEVCNSRIKSGLMAHSHWVVLNRQGKAASVQREYIDTHAAGCVYRLRGT